MFENFKSVQIPNHLEVICTAQKTMDGTEFHDVTITVEDDKEDTNVVKA